jgi:hypothetical protein
LDFNSEYDKFKEIIHKTIEISSTKVIKKINNPNLPRYILELIQEKRKTRKILAKSNNEKNKKHFNFLNKLVSEEIKAFKSQKIEKKCELIQKSNPSTKLFWKSIKSMENTAKNDDNIPYLKNNNSKIFDDLEKANVFGKRLETIFQTNEGERYDCAFKLDIEQKIRQKKLFKYDYCDFDMDFTRARKSFFNFKN